jgi:CBS domain-containing protein
MQISEKSARQLLARSRALPVSVSPDDTVMQALKVMADHDIGAVLVMQGTTMVGVLSERDFARKVELHGKTAATAKVREIMTEKVVYATPDNSMQQCMALMKAKHIRHLPVMEGSRVVGMLSARDVLEELISEEEELIRQLQQDRLYFTETGGTY